MSLATFHFYLRMAELCTQDLGFSMTVFVCECFFSSILRFSCTCMKIRSLNMRLYVDGR